MRNSTDHRGFSDEDVTSNVLETNGDLHYSLSQLLLTQTEGMEEFFE